MSNHRRRLKEIEVSLTPSQVVLLWLKNVVSRKYEDAVFESARPRAGLANSIARIVREGLKGQLETVVERAILQAHQEADWLYMIVVEVNHRVHDQFFASQREYMFLLAYLSTTMRCRLLSDSEELLRSTTLAFVHRGLLLEGSISRVSAERFAGNPILFSDSAAKLKEQIEWVDEVLEIFNSQAIQAGFRQLSKDEIRDSLAAAVERQVSCWSLLARGGMLAAFGEWSEFRASFKQLASNYPSE
jgi:hypothetical protein